MSVTGREHSDQCSSRRVADLLLEVPGHRKDDSAMALAIERATAELAPGDRAVVARFLEEAIAVIQRHAATLEHDASR